jgi:hypothetical protein
LSGKNVTLAYQALDYIRDHPAEWDQGHYICGTTACFAGRAVLIGLGLPGEEAFRQYQEKLYADGKTFRTWEVATELLGWTRQEAQYVFGCFTRDFTTLENAVKDVLNGKIR